MEEYEGKTWRGLLEEGTALLREAGVGEAQTNAWYLLSAAFGMDRVHYYLEQDRAVRPERLSSGYGAYREFLAKRAARIPLQQILGNQEFMGLTFAVDENVLIPRQDTETLVEAVLRAHTDPQTAVLDLCTGSGCIAVSLAVLGGYGSVTASDISGAALKVALKNAKRLFLIRKGTVRSQSFRLSEQPWKRELRTWIAQDAAGNGVREQSFTLLQSDCFREFEPEAAYDVIVSNPPYIPSAVIGTLEPEVRDHEPRIALDGMEDGLHFYRVLALECSRHLRRGGMVYFEIGCDQAAAVGRILEIAGYSGVETIRDAAGLDRVVSACWMR